MDNVFSAAALTLSVVGIIVAAVVAGVIAKYNAIVRARLNVEHAVGDIHVELRRRHDLIPNYVETVRACAGHEATMIRTVVRAHADAVAGLSRGSFAAENTLSSALLGIHHTLSVNYPQLRADTAYARASQQLVDSEDRLAIARRKYNDCVYRLGEHAHQWPGSHLAAAAGVKELPQPFLAPSETDSPPRIDLSPPRRSGRRQGGVPSAPDDRPTAR